MVTSYRAPLLTVSSIYRISCREGRDVYLTDTMDSEVKMHDEKIEGRGRKADEEMVGTVDDASPLTRQVLWKMDVRYFGFEVRSLTLSN